MLLTTSVAAQFDNKIPALALTNPSLSVATRPTKFYHDAPGKQAFPLHQDRYWKRLGSTVGQPVMDGAELEGETSITLGVYYERKDDIRTQGILLGFLPGQTYS